MTIVRVEKRENPYIVLDKTALNDMRLSWKAKGMHTYLMGKPDGWKVMIKDLIKQSPRDGRDACYVVLKELEKFGYIERRQPRLGNGKLGDIETVVFELPIGSKPLTENPDTAKPDTAKPDTANPDAYILMTGSNIHNTNPQSSIEVVVGIGGIKDSETAAPLPPPVCPPLRSGQPRAVESEREENSQQPTISQLLAKIRTHGKVSKDLKEAIAANPDAAEFGLAELNEALVSGMEIKNKMGYFRSQMDLVVEPKPKKPRRGASDSANAQSQAVKVKDIPSAIKLEDLGKYVTDLDPGSGWIKPDTGKHNYLVELEGREVSVNAGQEILMRDRLPNESGEIRWETVLFSRLDRDRAQIVFCSTLADYEKSSKSVRRINDDSKVFALPKMSATNQ